MKRILKGKPLNQDKVRAWAKWSGVAPGIIAGRLLQDKQGSEELLSDLLVPIDLTNIPSQAEEPPQQTLAALFAGRTGGLHGGGKAWSESTGKAFGEAMGEKYRHNRESTAR